MKRPVCSKAAARLAKAATGFSLVELMVAMAIGGIAIIVVMNVFMLSEKNRRTTISGDDATTSGMVAFAELQGLIRQAGQGITSSKVLGCTLSLPTSTTKSLLLSPLVVNSGNTQVPSGDSSTDTLLLIVGSGKGQPDGDGASISSTTVTPNTPGAISVGDFLIAAQQSRATPCNLSLHKVTATTSTTATVGTSIAAGNDLIFNLGATPKIVAYAIRNRRLTQCTLLDVTTPSSSKDCSATSNWEEVSDGVVSLRAQYYRDTSSPMNGKGDTWDQTSPTDYCSVSRISASRLALVVRNSEPMRECDQTGSDSTKPSCPTTAQPQWEGSTGAAISVPNPISTDTNDWKRYRYRVLESTVPLRNLSWRAPDLACP
jgi:type IV pilus assembly protein PilW